MCNNANRLQFLIRVIVVSLVLFSANAQDFGYEEADGPKHWGEKFHKCVGKHQSPINIQEHNVELVDLYPMVFENFDKSPLHAVLENNGHTVMITIKTDDLPKISGGPLVGKYEFKQLHFHWGSNDREGSETTINNSSFPVELHMVFFSSSYGSFQEATEHPDGLAVLAFLYHKSSDKNNKYEPLITSLPKVQNPNSTITVRDLPSFDDLLIEDRKMYYTYGGSLTTPPCSEVVTWIEFKKTIPLTHQQIEKFRHLKNAHGDLTHNFRPIQPLHGRIIRMNRGNLPSLEEIRQISKNNSRPNVITNNIVLYSLLFLEIVIYRSKY